jgi:hypothetical protein
LRRLAVLVAAMAALGCTSHALAAFQPLRHDASDLRSGPRVRPGRIHVPRGHAAGRVTVIVALRLPPLARAFRRGLYGFGAQRRLDLASSSSRAYLRALAAEQRTAVRAIRRAIPQARVSHRYSIVLDGLAVTLPATRLPRLAAVGVARPEPQLLA